MQMAMALFGRGAQATVTITPTVVAPRNRVRATAVAHRPIDQVRSARIELGYTNFYSYRATGRAAGGEESFPTEPGTDPDERRTSDWVPVDARALELRDGKFESATADFRVPSWAPPSSPELARWSCRLILERAGRDVDSGTDLTVVISPDDVNVQETPVIRVDGSASLIDIALDQPVWRAGTVIRGAVAVTPGADLPTADIGVYLQRIRLSHPLKRMPGGGEEFDGRVTRLDRRAEMRAHRTVQLPFELVLPPNAAPTASAVHSTLDWYVGARIFYAGFTGTIPERARRKIYVVNKG